MFTQTRSISVPLLGGIANPEHTDAELIAWLAGLLAALFPPRIEMVAPLRSSVVPWRNGGGPGWWRVAGAVSRWSRCSGPSEPSFSSIPRSARSCWGSCSCCRWGAVPEQSRREQRRSGGLAAARRARHGRSRAAVRGAADRGGSGLHDCDVRLGLAAAVRCRAGTCRHADRAALRRPAGRAGARCPSTSPVSLGAVSGLRRARRRGVGRGRADAGARSSDPAADTESAADIGIGDRGPPRINAAAAGHDPARGSARLAVALAFAVGFLVFQQHWTWVVLTAVSSRSGIAAVRM